MYLFPVTSININYSVVFSLAEFRRDLQAKFHITGGDRSQNDYDVSLLSEEVAVNIIEDIRRAAKRCLLVRY